MVSFLGAQAVTATPVAGSTGMPVATSGGANAKGDWAELIALTGHDAAWLLVNVGLGSAGDSLIDVGIGAAGSETVVVPDVPYSTNTSTIGVTLRLLLPLALPAGSRVALRHQAATASRVIIAQAHAIGRIAGGERGLGRVETLGVSLGTSRATAIDPGGSVNTKGAWVSLGTSAVPYHWIAAVVTHPEAVTSDSQWSIDIGIGPSSADAVVLPDLWYRADSTTDALMEQAWCLPFSVPAGTRFWARCQSSVTTATNRNVDVALVGVG